MKRFHGKFRLLASAAAAMLAGTALTVAVPSSATAATRMDATVDVTVTGLGCSPNGERHIFWVITNNTGGDIFVNAVSATPLGSSVNIVGSFPLDVPNTVFVAADQTIGPGFTGVAELTVTWAPSGGGGPFTAGGKQAIDKACPMFKAQFSPNCDGTTNVKLINEADNDVTFTVNGVEHPVGHEDSTDTLVVPNVPANAGHVVVTVDVFLIDDFLIDDFLYVKPNLCTPTGTDVTATVGIGALLLVAGAAIVLASVRLRRRRVRT